MGDLGLIMRAINFTARRGARVCFVGDSLIDYSVTRTTTNLQFNSNGVCSWIQALCGWRFNSEASDNYGAAGETSSQILLRIPAIAAKAYDIAVLDMGENNVNVTDASVLLADLNAAVKLFAAAGTHVVVLPVFPRSNTGVDSNVGAKNTIICGFNTALAAYCRTHRGISWAGQYLPQYIGTDGMAKAANLFDGTHPTPTGAKAIAQGAADIINAILPALPDRVAYSALDIYDAGGSPVRNLYGNMLANGMMTGSTAATTLGSIVSGVKPTPSWTNATSSSAVSSGTAVWSKQSPSPSGIGDAAVLTMTNVAGSDANWEIMMLQGPTTGFAAGDVLEAIAMFDVAASPVNIKAVHMHVRESDGSTSVDHYGMAKFAQSGSPPLAVDLGVPTAGYSIPIKSPQFTVRPYSGSGTASVQVRLGVIADTTGSGGASGVFKFYQPSLRHAV